MAHEELMEHVSKGCYTVQAILIMIWAFGLFLYGVYSPFDESHLNNCAVFVVSILIPILVLTMIIVLIRFVMKCMKIHQKTQISVLFAIVLLVSFTCGVIGRVVMIKWNPENFRMIFIVFSVCLTLPWSLRLSFFLVFSLSESNFRVNYHFPYAVEVAQISYVAQIVLSLILPRFANTPTILEYILHGLYQLIFVFFSQFLVEFLLVFSGCIEISLPRINIPIAPMSEAEIAKAAEEPLFGCQICCEEYSDENPARVLPECGHTLCSNCAANLLAQQNNRFIFCPVCQMPTVLKGDVFPENYALMWAFDRWKAEKNKES